MSAVGTAVTGSGPLDDIHAATTTLTEHGLGTFHRAEGDERHPTDAALDPLRDTGPIEVRCGRCDARICWAALCESGTCVQLGRRVRRASKRVGGSRDLIDDLGDGPMHEWAARPDMTGDRWQLPCCGCGASYPMRADELLRRYLRALGEAHVYGQRRPQLVLGHEGKMSPPAQ